MVFALSGRAEDYNVVPALRAAERNCLRKVVGLLVGDPNRAVGKRPAQAVEVADNDIWPATELAAEFGSSPVAGE